MRGRGSLYRPLCPTRYRTVSRRPSAVTIRHVGHSKTLPLHNVRLPPHRAQQRSRTTSRGSLHRPLHNVRLVSASAALVPRGVHARAHKGFRGIANVFSALSKLRFSNCRVRVKGAAISAKRRRAPLMRLTSNEASKIRHVRGNDRTPNMCNDCIRNVFSSKSVTIHVMRTLTSGGGIS